MPAYVLIEERISDRQTYATYLALAEQAIALYDGRIVAGGGQCEVLEGNWSPPERLMIVAFGSAAQAKTFYNSDEYGAARALRQNAATTNILLIAGLPL